MWHQNDTRAVITEHRNIKGVISEVNAIQDIWLATTLYIMVGSASVSKNTVPTLWDWHRINRNRGCSFRMFRQAFVLVSEAREEDFAKLLHFTRTSSGLSSWPLPEGLFPAWWGLREEAPNFGCLLAFLYQRNQTFAEGLTGGICLLSPLSWQVGKLRHNINCAAEVRAQHFPLWDQRFWFRT